MFGSCCSGSVDNRSHDVEVGEISAIRPGEMKEVAVGPGPEDRVLLVHTLNGEFFATSHKCPHYGAPLVKGILNGNRITCPWHGACFNACSGDIEDSPSLDSLQTYPVRKDGNKLYVSVPENLPSRRAFTPPAVTTEDSRVFVIVGGGAAGAVAAETLRKEGFAGRILVICKENMRPYDRVKLSKNLAVTAEMVALRTPEFYEQNRIQLVLGKEVTAVNRSSKTLTLSDGSSQRYDSLLLCTGGRAKNLNVAGGDLANVYNLRTFEDAQNINEKVQNARNVVIVGSSFIGMEAASALRSSKTLTNLETVTVVGRTPIPMQHVFGREIGKLLQDLHESKGVRFKTSAQVERLLAAEGSQSVGAVKLQGQDATLPADVVIVGVGVSLNTEFLRESGVVLAEDGSVVVDQYLRAADNIFVAGDICRFPSPVVGHHVRIEHWDVAQQQGRVAALNMLGKSRAFTDVPMFWTTQFGVSVRFVGHAPRCDEILIEGNLQERKFVALYLSRDQVMAAATMGTDPAAMVVKELMRDGKMPVGSELRGGRCLEVLMGKL